MRGTDEGPGSLGMGHRQRGVFTPGTRVAVDDLHGVVVEPTADELAYAATEYEGVGPHLGHVLVQLDGDEDWDRAWYAPDEIRVLDTEETR